MIFEQAKEHVQALFEKTGVPDGAVPEMKRRANFHSALAQTVVESDPDPRKRWSTVIAGWIVNGHVQSVSEHHDDITTFMAQRRKAKKVPRGAEDYAKACWLRSLEFGYFDQPHKVREVLDTYRVAERGQCGLPIEHITPCGIIVYRAEDLSEVQNDPAAKMARWCVLSSHWGGYGGPPYYPVERGGSWAGIIIPRGVRRIGLDQAFRNGGNSGMMDVDIITALTPFIKNKIKREEMTDAMRDWLQNPRLKCASVTSMLRLCVVLGMFGENVFELIMSYLQDKKVPGNMSDADLASVALNFPLLPLPDRSLSRLMEMDVEVGDRLAKTILSRNIGPKAKRSRMALDLLIKSRDEQYVKYIQADDGYRVMQEDTLWAVSMLRARAKRFVKFASYLQATEVDVTDDELISGMMYYGTIANGMVCLHLPSKDRTNVQWKAGEPFCVLMPLDFRISVAIAAGCIKPVRDLNRGMQQADDETVRMMLAMDGLLPPSSTPK